MRKLLVACLLLATPVAASAQKFAAFGDYGNQAGANEVATFVKGQSPTYILSLGDQCYDASPLISDQVGSKYSAWVNAKTFFPTLGNHEYNDACGGGSARAYFNYFVLPNNERYYDVVLGNVHLFSLNANSAREPDGTKANSKQGRWLKKQLAASKSPWKIVIMHQPPFSSGEHGNATYMQWPYEDWGADAVLSGHDHDYERFLFDRNTNGVKMPYFVAGLGGAEKRPFRTIKAGSVARYNAAFGALLINATSTSLNFEFRNTSGALIDSYSMAKGTAARTQTQGQFETQHVRACC